MPVKSNPPIRDDIDGQLVRAEFGCCFSQRSHCDHVSTSSMGNHLRQAVQEFFLAPVPGISALQSSGWSLWLIVYQRWLPLKLVSGGIL